MMATHTDEDLLALYKEAVAQLATAQSYTMPGGRSLTRASLPEIRKTIEWLEARIAIANPDTGYGTGFVFARF